MRISGVRMQFFMCISFFIVLFELKTVISKLTYTGNIKNDKFCVA